jgi:hypothetical protein
VQIRAAARMAAKKIRLHKKRKIEARIKAQEEVREKAMN